MPDSFYEKSIRLIRNIPRGKVLTYQTVAIVAGKPHRARQVAWILQSSSVKHDLPWWRVINSKGKISLPQPGYQQQKALLKMEGLRFGKGDKIDLDKYMWSIINN